MKGSADFKAMSYVLWREWECWDSKRTCLFIRLHHLNINLCQKLIYRGGKKKSCMHASKHRINDMEMIAKINTYFDKSTTKDRKLQILFLMIGST